MYIDKGRGYSFGNKTLVEVGSLSDMSTGDTCFCTDNMRLMTYDGAHWMCSDFVKLINGTGTSVVEGDLLVASTTLAGTAVATSTIRNKKVIGPVVFPASVGELTVIAIFGKYRVKSNLFQPSTGYGMWLVTSTTTKKAQPRLWDNLAGRDGFFAYGLGATGATAELLDCLIMPGVSQQ